MLKPTGPVQHASVVVCLLGSSLTVQTAFAPHTAAFMNSLRRMIIRDAEGYFPLLCEVEQQLEAVTLLLQKRTAGLNTAAKETTELIKSLRNIKSAFFKTRRKSLFLLGRFAAAREIYRKLHFQQAGETTEAPAFCLMLSGTNSKLQRAEECGGFQPSRGQWRPGGPDACLQRLQMYWLKSKHLTVK